MGQGAPLRHLIHKYHPLSLLPQELPHARSDIDKVLNPARSLGDDLHEEELVK